MVGIADLAPIEGLPIGLGKASSNFLGKYQYAVTMGAQLGNPSLSGAETSVFLEKIAIELTHYIFEERGYTALVVHLEDEFDPDRRIGLMSLKVLAKAAGLGWQGRSLLIISPEFGPIHRLIAILTDMPLEPDQVITNKCQDCTLCVDNCPQEALKLVIFEDHPLQREDVLNITLCQGDKGCKLCIVTCPWLRMPAEYESSIAPNKKG